MLARVAVLGVDACKAGWVGIRLDAEEPVRAFCAPTVEALVELAGRPSVVAVDIPIGLASTGRRVADGLARAVVGSRSSSVFTTPPRAVLAAATHAEAAALCRQLGGFGVSQQAFALGPKILEVDAWVERSDATVIEVHPEVSFATLAGEPLRDAKSTWAGFDRRRRLLARAGIVVDGDLGLGGRRVGPDDVLDAAVAAWSAERYARGAAISFPDPPELLGDALVAIWA